MKIQNPILRGFHPDPSVIRVGADYYIANSTFEWWPGVRLHHSRDLVHWELIDYPLNRVSQLDLRGVGASQGIWAPDLSYCDGMFYLVFTVVRSFYCNMYDTQNYLVTAEDIHGPWSEPLVLNNFGFDPSLFHDEDGRKYMVSMVTDHRIPKKYNGRLVLQEYDPVRQEMTGPVRDIFTADLFYLEGPHIYKRNGYYYLFAADTGTGEGHGQSILRSRNIWGAYELYKPEENKKIRTSEREAYSMMTARHNPDFLLQKSGHGDLVEAENGEWYMVHLCGRTLAQRNPPDAVRFPGERRYMLGRETALQKVTWTDDGWLKLANGSTLPAVVVEIPEMGWQREQADAESMDRPDDAAVETQTGRHVWRDDFDEKTLSLEYQSLRVPMDHQHLSLTVRPGWLRMYGRDGLASKFNQSMIARRLTEFVVEAETKLEFEPTVFKQMAGLICMYDTENYFYLHVTHDEEIGKCISILTAENKQYAYPIGFKPLDRDKPVYLKVQINYGHLQFSYCLDGDGAGAQSPGYQPIGPVFDASILSDEACLEGWFTGAMVGLCCQDLTGSGRYGDFDYFVYKELEEYR